MSDCLRPILANQLCPDSKHRAEMGVDPLTGASLNYAVLNAHHRQQPVSSSYVSNTLSRARIVDISPPPSEAPISTIDIYAE